MLSLSKRTDIRLFLAIALILTLPSLIFTFFNQSSLAVGLVFTTAIVSLLLAKESFRSFSFFWILGFYFFFSIILISSFFSFYSYQEIKPLASIALVVPIFVSGLIGGRISSCSFESILRSMRLVWFLLLFFGVLRFVYMPDFGGFGSRQKAVFPFSEESHYAIAMGILSISIIWASEVKFGFIVSLVLLFLAVYYPSLTMLVFAFIGFFSLSLRHPALYLPVIAICLASFPIIFSSEYFASRLNFESSNNLTTLVYLQGLQLMMKELDGFGVGFQMLGTEGFPKLYISEVIYEMTGEYMNLEDGGFLAAKLVAEFGFFGFLLVLAYTLYLLMLIFCFSLKVGAFSGTRAEDSRGKACLAGGAVLGFSVEMFLRGYGYFSPTLVLVLSFFPVLFFRVGEFIPSGE